MKAQQVQAETNRRWRQCPWVRSRAVKKGVSLVNLSFA
jgi:hypothetical protein